MSRLSLMTDYTLRMEVEALRQDLNQHFLDVWFGRSHHQQHEMFLWKKARLEALEAFATAQRVISQIDPRAVYTNYAQQRDRPYPRNNPYKREQKKTKAVGNNNKKKAIAGPVEKAGNELNTQLNAIKFIKVEPGDDAGDVQGAAQEPLAGRPLELLPVKLEEIKQEKDW